jgi:hypothetical protein
MEEKDEGRLDINGEHQQVQCRESRFGTWRQGEQITAHGRRMNKAKKKEIHSTTLGRLTQNMLFILVGCGSLVWQFAAGPRQQSQFWIGVPQNK